MGVLTGRRASAGVRAALLVAAVASVPALSAAQEGGEAAFSRRAYAFARVGVAFPRSAHLDALGFGTGGTLEVGAGFPVVRHVSLEASAGWISFQNRRSGWAQLGTDPGSPVEKFTATSRFDAVPLLASVRLSGAIGRLQIHALGGAGAFLASTDMTREASSSGIYVLSGSDTALGLHAGAGVAMALSPALTVGLGARWLHAEPTFRLRSSNTAEEPYDRAVVLDAVATTASFDYRF